MLGQGTNPDNQTKKLSPARPAVILSKCRASARFTKARQFPSEGQMLLLCLGQVA